MLLLNMALRNIFRGRKRSILTGIMMGGGCFLFSVSLGMADGSYHDIIEMFTRDHTGHVQVHAEGYLDKPSLYRRIRDADKVGEAIGSSPDVVAWAPRVISPALSFAGSKTSGLQIMGIDPVREPQTTRMAKKVTKGRFITDGPSYEVVISEGLASTLDVGLGDTVALIAQGADGSIANELFNVAGLTDEGGDYGVAMCYMHIDDARRFLALGGAAHEIAILLKDQSLARKEAPILGRMLEDRGFKGLDVEPWQVIESQFYRAMLADLKGNWISIFVISAILAVGVLNTVLMMILERTREFGVLKAIGTRPAMIFRLIVLETALLAAISIPPGILAGMAVNLLLSKHGIPLSEPVEYGGVLFQEITAMVTLKSMAVPALIVFLVAVAVSVFPALRAARVVPVRALRAQ